MAHSSPSPIDRRLRLTAGAMRAASRLARATGRGGSVVGGHVGLRFDQDLLARLSAGRRIVTVSATNGKTTTTNLLTAALRVHGPVVTNSQGSNLATGLVAALATDLHTQTVALEVDEATLATTAHDLRPKVIVLGNLSRDQLDRYGEVRIVAQRWQRMLADLQPDAPTVVANADDPLVAWAAGAATKVIWVAAGSPWSADAQVCPACTAPIVHQARHWSCTGCDLERPTTTVDIAGHNVIFHDAHGDLTVPMTLAIPGDFNIANAALALCAAHEFGIDPISGAQAMAATSQVEGRYRQVDVDGRSVRLLMAKNPAGWQAALGILRSKPTPVLVAINAQTADGHDPSWLFDVPFEVLRGRPVVASGERAHDLSVRLHYGDIDHTVVAGSALDALGTCPHGEVDLIANYTAFHTVLGDLR